MKEITEDVVRQALTKFACDYDKHGCLIYMIQDVDCSDIAKFMNEKY